MAQTGPTVRLDMEGRLAVFRPAPEVALRQAIALIEQAIATARQCRHDALLVVYAPAQAFEPPSLAARHEFVRRWACAADGAVRVALVVPAQYIDAERFGVAVAVNYGFNANVFPHESEARAWLDAHR